MKIGICGTQCIGKSTFTNDFIKQWPKYSKAESSYKKAIRDGNLNINRNGDEDGQRAIRDALADIVIETKESHVIYDRCILDNLVYSMHLNGAGKVSDEFVKETIAICKSTLVFYDIIFFLPITKHSPVNIEKAEQRDINPEFRDEVDVLFKTLMSAYFQKSTVLFPFDTKEGCPALIEIFGTREERIKVAQLYLNEGGDIFGEDESLLDASQLLDQDGIDLAKEIYPAVTDK
jgi:hypothetical protein